jgi:predicted  nucleic acid-binding Zn-ribbon protein
MMLRQTEDEVHESGDPTDAGSFQCLDCSLPLALDHTEEMPRCPSCGGSRFQRASLFDHASSQPTLTQITIQAPREAPEGWLDEVRESIEEPGKYLAFYADGHAKLLPLEHGWSRIGRSASADIRLDDPTVSRRHAVVVCTPEGELNALDDRSTNGILVNGMAVDWSPLSDGDALQIGRYALHVVESTGARTD